MVCENTETKEDWKIWARRAVESVYGYEFQGDNLLLARENVLYTYIEYYRHKFEEEPELKELLQIALVISWNLWQMDGFNYAIPYCEKPDEPWQLTIFDQQGNITDQDISLMALAKQSDSAVNQLYEVFRDLGDIQHLLPESVFAQKDQYESILDDLFNIVIDAGITSYLMARNYEQTLTATNYLKKDKNYYDIIGFQWATMKQRVLDVLKRTDEAAI